jgi:hypothetical protein
MDSAESYAEEIRLSRALARALEEDKIYLHKEALAAYNKLLDHYEMQMEEQIQ